MENVENIENMPPSACGSAKGKFKW